MRFSHLFILGMVFLLCLSYVSAFSTGRNDALYACKKECKSEYSLQLGSCRESFLSCKSSSTNIASTRLCMRDKSSCTRSVGSLYRACQHTCSELSKPKGCLNDSVKIGGKFADGCNICECKSNGRISCRREQFCNMNASASEPECVQSGGLFQQLCNGPYFDIVCSQLKYCLCEGDYNYTCPENYQCLKEFISPNSRISTVAGWKTLLGKPLGNIGICVK